MCKKKLPLHHHRDHLIRSFLRSFSRFLKVLIRLPKARLKVLLKVLIRLLKARLKVLLKVLVRLLKACLKVLLKVGEGPC